MAISIVIAFLAAYVQGDAQHVICAGTDGHLYELWHVPGQPWKHTDLTTAPTTPAPAPHDAARLAGYITSDAQHVIFVGTDSHLHELWQVPGQAWTHTDLTVAPATPVPTPHDATQLAGYTTTDAQHVVFVGTDGHLHELWQVPGQPWMHTDLTGQPGSPAPDPNHGLAAFTTPDAQHVIFIGFDSHVYELWQVPGQQWMRTDLTTAPPLAINPGFWTLIAGYVTSDARHVIVLGTDDILHELWQVPGHAWQHSALTGPPTKPVPYPYRETALAGYATSDAQHVIFVREGDHLYEQWQIPGQTWDWTDVTQNSGAPDVSTVNVIA